MSVYRGLHCPYTYKCEISALNKFKMAVLTVVVFPFRAIATALTFASVLFISSIISRNFKTEAERPEKGLKMQYVFPILKLLARLCYFCGGIQWIKVRGKRADRSQAPIFVVAPHSSFLDSLVVVYLGMNSVVTVDKYAESNIAGVIRITQPIVVNRDDPESRKNTVLHICSRAHSHYDWPQIVIFPEGTCSNRKQLLSFKLGAFQPGLPVQPIVVRWPNKVDSVTWAWEGPTVLQLLWMTMTQFNTHLDIEFLPVYTPSEEEKSDPTLFANNVRKVMAECLQLPTCDLTYDDFCRIRLANHCGLPDPVASALTERLTRSFLVDSRNFSRFKCGPEATTEDCQEYLLSRLEDLLTLARKSPSLKRSAFIEAIYPTAPPGKSVMQLVNLVIDRYYTSSGSLVNFRQFVARVCMFAMASKIDVAIHHGIKVYPCMKTQISCGGTHPVSTKKNGTNSPSWIISIPDAIDFLCDIFQFDQARLLEMMSAQWTENLPSFCNSSLPDTEQHSEVLRERLTRVGNFGVTSGDIYNLLVAQAPDVLTCYQQFVSQMQQLPTHRTGMSPSVSSANLDSQCTDKYVKSRSDSNSIADRLSVDPASSTLVRRHQ